MIPFSGMLETDRQSAEAGPSARQRILDASYELFSQRGIRGVGVNEVIERAGVATATLYRHFPSKDRLVLAFLEMREQRWTHGLVVVPEEVVHPGPLEGWLVSKPPVPRRTPDEAAR